jgi:hypothetical protein
MPTARGRRGCGPKEKPRGRLEPRGFVRSGSRHHTGNHPSLQPCSGTWAPGPTLHHVSTASTGLAARPFAFLGGTAPANCRGPDHLAVGPPHAKAATPSRAAGKAMFGPCGVTGGPGRAIPHEMRTRVPTTLPRSPRRPTTKWSAASGSVGRIWASPKRKRPRGRTDCRGARARPWLPLRSHPRDRARVVTPERPPCCMSHGCIGEKQSPAAVRPRGFVPGRRLVPKAPRFPLGGSPSGAAHLRCTGRNVGPVGGVAAGPGFAARG